MTIEVTLGGNVSGSTLTGGTTLSGPALGLIDYSGLDSHPGYRNSPPVIAGRDGVLIPASRGNYQPRRMLLSIYIGDRDPSGTITSPDGACGELVDNLDDILTLANQSRLIVSKSLPDSSVRFVTMTISGESTVFEGPVRGSRRMLLPLIGDSMWSALTLSTDTISGADTLTTNGRVVVRDPVLTFAGDGTFTNSTTGDELVIAGSGGAVTVDVGARSVTEGGNDADNLLTPDTDQWMTFAAGANTVNSTVSVQVDWRDKWA